MVYILNTNTGPTVTETLYLVIILINMITFSCRIFLRSLSIVISYYILNVAFADNLSDAMQSNFQCTKCNNLFPTRTVLHQHIVDCGDYWRDLGKGLKYVYVLRGTEVPSADKKSKKRGKFHHWCPHESPRKPVSKQQKVSTCHLHKVLTSTYIC